MFSFHDALLWFQHHVIEIIAVITGLLYVAFTIKENILLWLFGILSSALYIHIFLKSGIYAYALLYIYYVLIGFYGWYNWGKKDNNEIALKVTKTPGRILAGCIAATVVITVPVYFALKRFTDSDMAAVDALLTAGGMVATWMLTRKYIEQWLFWIIIDLTSFGAMIYKGLYPSALLFLVYALLAIKGFFEWRKNFTDYEYNPGGNNRS